MGFFKNKFLVKLIATLCLFLTLFNFAGVNRVYAEDEVWGGVLIKPVTNLLVGIADSAMELLHKTIQAQGAAIIKVSGSETWWDVLASILSVVAGIVAAVAFIALVVVTGGVIGAAAAALAGTVASMTFTVTLGTVMAGAAAGIAVGVAVHKELIPNDIYLPAFSITTEEIFNNSLHLFDVNFFDPMPDESIRKKWTSEIKVDKFYSKELSGESEIENWKSMRNKVYTGGTVAKTSYIDRNSFLTNYNLTPREQWSFNKLLSDIESSVKNEDYKNWNNINPTLGCVVISNPRGVDVNEWTFQILLYFGGEVSDYNKIEIDIDYRISTEQKETITVSSALTTKEKVEEEVEIGKIVSTAKQLKDVVSTWYFILRNLALIVLMLVLIYTGIRIVIGSTAGEKAKYKERLTDWIVAICLVMVMHYIMVFSVEIVEKLTDLISVTTNGNVAYIELTETQRKNADRVLQSFDTTGNGTAIDESCGEQGAIYWPTDLVGMFRIQSQFEGEGTANWVAYSCGYVILVAYTIFFAFTYLRRVVYMAFLTIIAPLVAMTYPIDKMTDGKAQAFDAWFKEYIFNLLIQPMHLLLYTILVTSAYTLASENVLYTLVALGFMLPAEKLMRRFFGFEKAKTPGLLGGAAGAALTMSGMQKLLGHKPPHAGKPNENSAGGNAQKQTKVKFANKNKINSQDAIVGGGVNPQQNSTEENTESEREQNVRQSDVVTQNPESQDSNENAEDSTTIDTNPGRQEEQNINPTGPSLNRGRTGEIPIDIDPAGNNRHRRHPIKAAKTIGVGLGKQAAASVLRGVHPVRMFGKAMAGVTGAVAGGLVGVATGDPNKVLQYSGIGGGAAMKFAGSLSNRELTSNDLKEEAKMSLYGEDYKDVMVEKEKKQFLKSDENINYIRKTMSVDAEQAREILETTGGQCFDNGIEDIDDIVTIHELTHSGNNSMSFEKAVAGRSYAKKRLGGADLDSMTPDKINKYKERWKNEFKAKYNFDDNTAKQYAEEAFNIAIRFDNTKASLNKV